MTYVLGTKTDFGAGETRCDLHRAGCTDIKRAGYEYIDEVESVKYAVETGLVCDADDVTIKPCAKARFTIMPPRR